MIARDDAVAAMAAVFGDGPDGIYEGIESTLSAAGYEPLFELLLDAIPPRVLAQLAIDTGALKRLVLATFDRDVADGGPIYRLAEDGGPGGS